MRFLNSSFGAAWMSCSESVSPVTAFVKQRAELGRHRALGDELRRLKINTREGRVLVSE